MMPLCGQIRSISAQERCLARTQKPVMRSTCTIRSSLCVVEALAEHLGGAQHGHEGVQVLLVDKILQLVASRRVRVV